MSLMRLALPLISFYFFSAVHAAGSASWRSRNVYMALTDRLAQTGGGAAAACGDLSNYCGGTFAGLQSKLDYIQGMGFDAIWINPVISNSPGGYHGYWAQDIYVINSYYGTSSDLINLVNAAHSRGIYMMVDVVANHVGYADMSTDSPSLLTQSSSYHTKCDIDYSSQNSIQECWLAGLPDLYTEHADIRSLYQSWIVWLVQTYGFDGIRIDTVKHVEMDYWPGFVTAAGVYAIGEVYSGDPSYVAGYSGVMPGLLNYPLYFPLSRAYSRTGSSFQDLVNMHEQISSMFPDPTLLGTFVDNHDQPRFLSIINDHSLFRNALAYVILGRGIPIVYYGTEQGFTGANDPSNREDLWRSGYSRSSDMYQGIAKLSAARKRAGGLAGNDHVHLFVSGQAYIWSRVGGALIVITSSLGSGASGTFCFAAQQRPGTQYTDIYGAGMYVVDSSGNLCATVNNGEPIVLLQSGFVTPTTSTTTTSSTTTTTKTTSTTTSSSTTFVTSTTKSTTTTTTPVSRRPLSKVTSDSTSATKTTSSSTTSSSTFSRAPPSTSVVTSTGTSTSMTSTMSPSVNSSNTPSTTSSSTTVSTTTTPLITSSFTTTSTTIISSVATTTTTTFSRRALSKVTAGSTTSTTSTTI